MELFETIMTVFAVVVCGGAWFFMQRKQGKGLLDSFKGAKDAVGDAGGDDD